MTTAVMALIARDGATIVSFETDVYTTVPDAILHCVAHHCDHLTTLTLPHQGDDAKSIAAYSANVTRITDACACLTTLNVSYHHTTPMDAPSLAAIFGGAVYQPRLVMHGSTYMYPLVIRRMVQRPIWPLRSVCVVTG